MSEEKIEDLKEKAEETPEVKEEVKAEVEEVETAENVKAEEVQAEAEEVQAEADEVAEVKSDEVAEEIENGSGRTLAEAIEIAEKTVKSPKKQYNKKGILAVTALILVVALLFSFAFANTVKMSDEEYYALFEESSIEIVEDAYNTVIILSARMSYYSENEYIDTYYAEALAELESSVAVTDEMMKELSNPPSTYEEHYVLLKNFYASYIECLDLALDYGDDETAYVEVATIAVEEFIEYYSALYNAVMENYVS